MKIFVKLLFILVLSFSLVACNVVRNEDGNGESSTTAASTQIETTMGTTVASTQVETTVEATEAVPEDDSIIGRWEPKNYMTLRAEGIEILVEFTEDGQMISWLSDSNKTIKLGDPKAGVASAYRLDGGEIVLQAFVRGEPSGAEDRYPWSLVDGILTIGTDEYKRAE